MLGLPTTAGRDEVKQAYFDAAKRFHPDRLSSMGLETLRPEVEEVDLMFDYCKRAVA